jgi:chorismate synthase
MSGGEDSPPREPKGEAKTESWTDRLSVRRIAGFLRNVVTLESSVCQLTTENRDLRSQIAELQRQQDRQGGQVDILAEFVRSSLQDRIDSQVERAVIRALVRLQSPGGVPKDEGSVSE